MLSSAKSLSLLCCKYSKKSFMYIRNKIGPRTVPWGTPEVTGTDVDDVPSRTTVCVLSDRNACIQLSVLCCIP